MGKTKIVLNSEGVKALLRSEEMRAGLSEIARSILASCGEGYAGDTKRMGTRVIASVYTETEDAMRDNLENNTILKGL